MGQIRDLHLYPLILIAIEVPRAARELNAEQDQGSSYSDGPFLCCLWPPVTCISISTDNNQGI